MQTSPYLNLHFCTIYLSTSTGHTGLTNTQPPQGDLDMNAFINKLFSAKAAKANYAWRPDVNLDTPWIACTLNPTSNS